MFSRFSYTTRALVSCRILTRASISSFSKQFNVSTNDNGFSYSRNKNFLCTPFIRCYSSDLEEAQRLYEKGCELIDVENGIYLELNERGDTEEKVKAFQYFKQAAEKGLQSAVFATARCIGIGYGCTANNEEALEFYNFGILHNNAECHVDLGESYVFGFLGLPRDIVKAAEHYKIAADLGNTEGKRKLAYLYSKGIGVAQDIDESVRYIKSAVDDGDLASMKTLGDYYFDGFGVERNVDEAKRMYIRAAESNDAESALRLMNLLCSDPDALSDWIKYFMIFADITDDGKYLFKECFKAEYSDETKQAVLVSDSLQKSGHAEFIPTIGRLGVLYYAGKGFPEDYQKAYSYLRIGAENGDVISLYNLGMLYFYGRGVTQNYQQAAIFIRAAAAKGFPDALNQLGHCFRGGYGVEKNPSKAFECFKKGSDVGFPEAHHSVGKCYEIGLGIDKDDKKAFEFYKLAADNNNVDGINDLAKCYEEGRGIEKDTEMAKKLFEKATHIQKKPFTVNQYTKY